MTRLVHGIVSLTAEQIDLIVELLPQPLERELLEEGLSPTLRHEVEHDLERVDDILEILLDAKEARPTTDLGLDLPLTLEGTDR